MFASPFVLLAAALSISATSVAPSPTVGPPLREIGHVRASAYCAELALHANTAISAALRNDFIVIQAIDKMRKAKLDANVITRRNTLTALGDLAKDLRARAVAGDREADKLREYAAKSKDPDQQKELKEFADALGGALYRQKQMANDLNGMLATFDYHEMKPTPDEMLIMQAGMPGAGTVINPAQGKGSKVNNLRSGTPSNSNEQNSDSDLARIAAEDFQKRSFDVTTDESIAANHAVGAVSGC